MIAIVNGYVMTMEGKDFPSGTVLIENNVIKAVGENITIPEGAQVIDVQGKYILPGLIDAHSHVGIAEEIYQFEGDDTNEMTEPITPQLRALDAINPYDVGFKDALEGGVTTVMVAPGSANVVGGMATVVKTHGKVLDDMVVIPEVGMKVAFGENPKRVYGEQKKMPSTRMATAAMLRETLINAQNYQAKIVKAQKDNELVERDLGMENMVKVLNGDVPIRAHAHRADDILTALRIAKEFNIKLIIEHCTEGHKIVDVIKNAGVPAVVGPTLSNRSKVELGEIGWHTIKELNEAGILVSIMTDHPVIPLKYLTLLVALAVKAGMPEEDALKAVTINPAQILGLEDRIGSLKENKEADIVIFSGHPLDWRSNVEKVMIGGNWVL